MSRVYYINARKLVQLEQVEVEAESKEIAIDAYLAKARAGDIGVAVYGWSDLTEGDLDVEDHGEGKDEPF